MANVQAPNIKRGYTVFLQIVIVLFGIGVATFLIWEPHVEGVNAHATVFQMYFSLFVGYVYFASIPFFVGLYQAVKVLGYAGQNRIFSHEAVKALRNIKYCALLLIIFAAISVLFMLGAEREDRPAGTFMRLLVAFPSIIVAAASAVFERILRNAVELKSENDLTV